MARTYFRIPVKGTPRKRSSAVALAVGLICLTLLIVADNSDDNLERDSGRVRMSGAFEALSFRARERAYPELHAPGTAYSEAYGEHRRRVETSAAKQASIPPWRTLGPHNLAGRMLALAFNPQNPNTIYAGSASGGLWRSYSAGRGAAAWERVTIGHPVLGVSSIAFAPGDSTTLYIGTGEVYWNEEGGESQAARWLRGSYGLGILKSSDGGRTWTKSLDWSYAQQRGVWALEVNPLNPNTVWSATTEGVFRSFDAGVTWEHVHDVIMAMDLVVQPVDTNIVIATHGNFASDGHGIYRTTDAGLSWTKATTGLPDAYEGKAVLDMSRSNHDILFASIGNGFSVNSGNATWLAKSTDAGSTWTVVSTYDYTLWQGWYAHDVAIHPNDPDILFLGGISMHKTLNGGEDVVEITSFDPAGGPIPPGEPEGPPNYMHGDHHDILFHPTNPDVVYFANDAGVWRSTDGGVTFDGCNGGLQTTQFYGGFSSSQRDSNLAIGGLQDNASAIFAGSTTWSRYHLQIARGDGGWTAIDRRNDRVIYASNWFLNLYKSVDGGATFTAIIPPIEASTMSAFEAPAVLGVNNPDILYGGREYIYKSFNGGASWTIMNLGQPLDNNPMLSMAISHRNAEVVYAASAPIENPGMAVFRSRNGGISWDEITGDLPDRFPRDLALNPENDQEVYIAFSGFGSSHVFRSDNGGDDWIDVGDGLPDVPTSAIIVDPEYSEHVYVGNDVGVYVSPDRGRSWEPYSDGLPEALMVVDLSISGSNRKLRAVTHGNGVFERDLATPEVLPTETEQPSALRLALDPPYPNPTSGRLNLHFMLDRSTLVDLSVWDVVGRPVATLIKDRRLAAGAHHVEWDTRDPVGIPLAAGTYVVRLAVGGRVASRMIIVGR